MARRRSSILLDIPPLVSSLGLKETTSHEEEKGHGAAQPQHDTNSWRKITKLNFASKQGMKVEDGEDERLLGESKDEHQDGNILGTDDRYQWEKILGIGLFITLIKCCIKGGTDVIVKSMVGIHPIILIFYRSIIILTLTLPMSIVKDQPPFPTNLSLQDRLLLVLRSIIGLLQVMANFFALQQMPIGIVKIIISTKPVFTIIFARIFIKEKCDMIDGVSMLLMMGGIVIVIEPWKFNLTDTDSNNGHNVQIATILLLVSTIMASNIGIILRKFKDIGVVSLSSSREIIYIIFTFWIIFIWSISAPSTSSEYCWLLLLLGICGLLTATLNIIALKVEGAGKIALVDRSSSIIIGFIIQVEVFKELPSNITWLGVGLVLIAIIIIGVKKILKKGT